MFRSWTRMFNPTRRGGAHAVQIVWHAIYLWRSCLPEILHIYQLNCPQPCVSDPPPPRPIGGNWGPWSGICHMLQAFLVCKFDYKWIVLILWSTAHCMRGAQYYESAVGCCERWLWSCSKSCVLISCEELQWLMYVFVVVNLNYEKSFTLKLQNSFLLTSLI